jgi:hypothetical protein
VYSESAPSMESARTGGTQAHLIMPLTHCCSLTGAALARTQVRYLPLGRRRRAPSLRQKTSQARLANPHRALCCLSGIKDQAMCGSCYVRLERHIAVWLRAEMPRRCYVSTRTLVA